MKEEFGKIKLIRKKDYLLHPKMRWGHSRNFKDKYSIEFVHAGQRKTAEIGNIPEELSDQISNTYFHTGDHVFKSELYGNQLLSYRLLIVNPETNPTIYRQIGNIEELIAKDGSPMEDLFLLQGEDSLDYSEKSDHVISSFGIDDNAGTLKFQSIIANWKIPSKIDIEKKEDITYFLE